MLRFWDKNLRNIFIIVLFVFLIFEAITSFSGLYAMLSGFLPIDSYGVGAVTTFLILAFFAIKFGVEFRLLYGYEDGRLSFGQGFVWILVLLVMFYGSYKMETEGTSFFAVSTASQKENREISKVRNELEENEKILLFLEKTAKNKEKFLQEKSDLEQNLRSLDTKARSLKWIMDNSPKSQKTQNTRNYELAQTEISQIQDRLGRVIRVEAEIDSLHTKAGEREKTIVVLKSKIETMKLENLDEAETKGKGLGIGLFIVNVLLAFFAYMASYEPKPKTQTVANNLPQTTVPPLPKENESTDVQTPTYNVQSTNVQNESTNVQGTKANVQSTEPDLGVQAEVPKVQRFAIEKVREIDPKLNLWLRVLESNPTKQSQITVYCEGIWQGAYKPEMSNFLKEMGEDFAFFNDKGEQVVNQSQKRTYVERYVFNLYCGLKKRYYGAFSDNIDLLDLATYENKEDDYTQAFFEEIGAAIEAYKIKYDSRPTLLEIRKETRGDPEKYSSTDVQSTNVQMYGFKGVQSTKNGTHVQNHVQAGSEIVL